MKVLLHYSRGDKQHMRIIEVRAARKGSLWKALANYTADRLEATLTAFNVITD